MKKALILLFFLFLVGCQSPLTDKYYVSFGVPFELSINQTAYIQNEDLSITFNSVPQDSRCLVSVQCIWQGKVTIMLTIETAGQQDDFLLNSTEQPLQNYNQYHIEIVSIKPDKTDDGQIKDYKVTLLITSPV
jgi:hypothetical protein